MCHPRHEHGHREHAPLHLVDQRVVVDDDREVLHVLRARVLQRQLDLEARPEPLHLRCQPEGRPGRVRERPLSIGDHFDICPRSRETQLAEVALEDAVHLGRLLALALRLLHIKLRLLRYAERHVLFGRRTVDRRLRVEFARALQDFDGEPPRAAQDGEAALFAPVAPEAARRHRLAHAQRRKQRLLDVKPDLTGRHRHHQSLSRARALELEEFHVDDGRGQVDGVHLLAAQREPVHRVRHAAHHDRLLKAH